jgi:hypothetical protein
MAVDMVFSMGLGYPQRLPQGLKWLCEDPNLSIAVTVRRCPEPHRTDNRKCWQRKGVILCNQHPAASRGREVESCRLPTGLLCPS